MVKLYQPNLRNSIKMLASYVLIGAIIGFCYHYRFGYDLIEFPPVPEREIPAQVREGIEPKICVGFRPDEGKIGSTARHCPKNHAMFANNKVGGKNKSGPGNYVRLEALCCPLPANDILTDRHTYNEFEECPDQYVATGGSGRCQDKCLMRCTQINTKKYRLGTETVAWYFQHRTMSRLHGQGDTKKVYWDKLPASIRYGAGRRTHKTWSINGCIGVPLGSLLTKKNQKRCDGFHYRELQYLDGTPVKMLPDCQFISDPYASNPRCLDNESEIEVQPVVIIHRSSREPK